MDTTTETKTAPSPYDIQKLQTLQQLQAILLPQLIPQLAGGMTAGQAGQYNKQATGTAANMAKMGIPKGSPTFANALSPVSAGNNDALNYALQLYGIQPSGGSSATTTTQPGAMDIASSAGQLAMMYKLLNRGGGGGINQAPGSGWGTAPSGGGISDSGGFFVNEPM